MTLSNRESEEVLHGIGGQGLRSCRIRIGMIIFRYLMLE